MAPTENPNPTNESTEDNIVTNLVREFTANILDPLGLKPRVREDMLKGFRFGVRAALK